MFTRVPWRYSYVILLRSSPASLPPPACPSIDNVHFMPDCCGQAVKWWHDTSSECIDVRPKNMALSAFARLSSRPEDNIYQCSEERKTGWSWGASALLSGWVKLPIPFGSRGTSRYYYTLYSYAVDETEAAAGEHQAAGCSRGRQALIVGADV